ncbi:Bet1-like protein [Acorus calamus]|uniref:Bet1-like protein n=1 Tax=Acorus calamus TaxID=4465 RepID=A0AAV9CC42_ACOCL|nr:Bet1-like protein [Acorus calamus]
MANSYGPSSLRSREGVNARSGTNSDEIQLRIDPMHADLDEEINGLYGKVHQLRNVAQEIETEAKVQKDFVSELAAPSQRSELEKELAYMSFILYSNMVMAIINTNSNDANQSSSWDEEQYEKVEQEYHSTGIQPCHSCGFICVVLFLHGLSLVEVCQKVSKGDITERD